MFTYSGVQHTLCCALFSFVLCTQCCQFLWIVHFWLPFWYSLAFIYILVCTRNNHSIAILFNRPAELQLHKKEEKEPLIKEEKHSHHGYGFLTKSTDSYQSIDVIASSSDEQAVYNPHVPSFTDSYQSIQSLDSSVNSFRNSFVFKYNSSHQHNVSI